MTDEQADALEAAVHRADLGDAAGIDLHVVTTEVAGAPTREPVVELYVGRYSTRSRSPGVLANPTCWRSCRWRGPTVARCEARHPPR